MSGRVRKKNEMDQEIARQSGVNYRDVMLVTGLLLDKMKKALAEGDEVFLAGFGRFTRSGKIRKKFIPMYGRNDRRAPIMGVMYKVYFKKSDLLNKAILEYEKSKEVDMDKFGVDESVNDEKLEKQAAQGCPKCGAKLERHGKVLICPNCGSEPFEKNKE